MIMVYISTMYFHRMLCSEVEAEFRWCVVQKDTSPRCREVLQCKSPYPWMQLFRWVGFLFILLAMDRLRGRRLTRRL